MAGLLDVKEIVFRRDFTQRQNLDPVRRVHEQVAEVAQTFRVPHRFTHLIDVRATLSRIGHIEDIPGVLAVLVILTAE